MDDLLRENPMFQWMIWGVLLFQEPQNGISGSHESPRRKLRLPLGLSAKP